MHRLLEWSCVNKVKPRHISAVLKGQKTHAALPPSLLPNNHKTSFTNILIIVVLSRVEANAVA